MEIVALHVRITDLLFSSLQFLEEYDCETVGMSFRIIVSISRGNS